MDLITHPTLSYRYEFGLRGKKPHSDKRTAVGQFGSFCPSCLELSIFKTILTS